MKEFLKKLKLISDLEIQLEIQKSEFVNILSKEVDKGSVSSLFDIFEVFSSSKNELKGNVDINGFKIKIKRKFFDMYRNKAIAEGTYIQKDNLLIINTEINGFHVMMIPYYVLVTFFYLYFIILFLLNNIVGDDFLIFSFFMLLHASLMLGIPYFIMRSSVKKLKNKLNTEFTQITKRV